MTTETSLLDRIRDTGHEASVIATYNVSFSFYEGVVLPRLRASGCRHNVLLADASMVAQALSDPATRPALAGRAYTLIPVSAAGAFHPKIVLLTGRKKATLHIGSHNLTYAGWSHNRELTTTYEVAGADAPNAATVRSAWNFLRDWTNEMPSPLIAAFVAIEDVSPWLAGTDVEGTELFGSHRKGLSLWDRVRPHLPLTARRILVSGPFFDNRGAFVRRLQRDLQPKEIVVAIDPGKVSLDPVALVGLGGVRLVPVSDTEGASHGYLHAKAVLVESGDGSEVLVVGSANPTAAAWLATGASEGVEGPSARRNAEAVVVRRGAAGSLGTPLGLAAWLDQPSLSAEELAKVRQGATEPGESIGGAAPIIAVASDTGFELSADPRLSHGVAVRLLDGQSSLLAQGRLAASAAGWHVAVDDPRVRSGVALLSLTVESGELLAIAHHPEKLSALAPSNVDPHVARAIAALDGDTPDFEKFLDLVSRVLFDEDKHSSTAPGAGRSSQANTGTPDYTELGVDAQQAAEMQARRRRTASNLTALVDALLRRLADPDHGAGASGVAARTAKSEEERVGGEDPDDAEDEDRDFLIRACRRRSKLLVDRLAAQLSKKGLDPNVALLRSTAVLAALRHLRLSEHKLVGRVAGQSLVAFETREAAFDLMAYTLFGPAEIVAKAVNSRSKDISFAKGLAGWLARDVGFDVRHAMRKKSNEDAAFVGRQWLARALRILPAVASDSTAVDWARDAIGAAGSEWADFHVAWGRGFAEALDDPLACAEAAGVLAGDIAFVGPPGRMKLAVVVALDHKYVEVDDGYDVVKYVPRMVRVVARGINTPDTTRPRVIA